MSRRNQYGFSGYASQKPQYYRELWNEGEVAKEARRIARNDYIAELRQHGVDPNTISNRAIDHEVDVLLFNSEDHYLARAKFGLEYRKWRR